MVHRLTGLTWRPDFERDGSAYATFNKCRSGTSATTIVCLFDPPRLILAPEEYLTAQENIARVCESVPGWPDNIVVGLQERAWAQLAALEHPEPTPESEPLPHGPLQHGAVRALASADPSPSVARLESRERYETHQALEASVLDLIPRLLPIVLELVAAFRSAEQAAYSSTVAMALELEARLNSGAVSLRNCTTDVVQLIHDSQIDFELPRYRALRELVKLVELESALGPVLALGEHRSRLTKDIHDAARPSNIGARASWELALIELRDRPIPESPTLLREAAQALSQDPVPPPPAPIIGAATQLILRRFPPHISAIEWVHKGNKADAFSIDHDAETVSHLLEAARVLGLDLRRYRELYSYLEYVALQARLEAMARRPGGTGTVAGEIHSAFLRIFRDIIDATPKSEVESVLLSRRAAVDLFLNLCDFGLHHNNELNASIETLSLIGICDDLERCQIQIRPDLRTDCMRLEHDLLCVRRLHVGSVLRAKRIANSAVMTARNQGLGWLLIVCDGYLGRYILSWLDELVEEDLTYYSVLPSWTAHS